MITTRINTFNNFVNTFCDLTQLDFLWQSAYLLLRPLRRHIPRFAVRLEIQARLVVIGQRDAAHRADQR